MDQTKNALQRLYNAKEKLQRDIDLSEDRELTESEENIRESFKKHIKDFEKSMDDDLNTADAITAIFDLVKDINVNLNENSAKKILIEALDLLKKLTKVLGIMEKEENKENYDEEVLKLIKEREQARKDKDFKKADSIRNVLFEKGIEIKDTRKGTEWKRL